MTPQHEPAALPPIPAAEDRVAVRPVLLTATVAILVAALGTLAVLGLGGTKAGPAPQAGLPPQRELTGLSPDPIGHLQLAAQQASEARQRLATYGWVDRRAEIVRVPIDRAIDLLIAEEGKR